MSIVPNKHAVNNTIGNENFRPLDRMVARRQKYPDFLVFTKQSEKDYITNASFSHNNDFFVYVDDGYNARIFERVNDETINEFRDSDKLILPEGATPARVKFSYDGKYLAFTNFNNTPYVFMYKFNPSTNSYILIDNFPDSFKSTIFLEFSQDNKYLMVTGQTAPYIEFYKIENDILTLLPTPTQALTRNAVGATMGMTNSGELYAATCSYIYINIYKKEGDEFVRTHLLTTSITSSVSFTKDASYIAGLSKFYPYVYLYKRNGDNFTRINTLQIPESVRNDNIGCDIHFSRDGNYLYVALLKSPYFLVYERNGDTFTNIKAPNYIPSTIGDHSTLTRSVNTSFDDKYLIITSKEYPYLCVYINKGIIDATYITELIHNVSRKL